jgi:hypothetical protein
MLALCWALFLLAEDPDKLQGAPIPPGSHKLDDSRATSSRGYDDTVEFYEKLYKGNANWRFRSIISAPGIKAVHLQNHKGSGGWSGLNIYEANNKTRIFVLKTEK